MLRVSRQEPPSIARALSVPAGCKNLLRIAFLLIKLSKPVVFPAVGYQDGSRKNLPLDLTGLWFYSLRFPLTSMLFITINVPTDALAVYITA